MKKLLFLVIFIISIFSVSYCANYNSYNGSFDFYNTFIDIAQLTGSFNSSGFNNLTNFVDLLKDPTTSFILRGYRTNSGSDLYAYVYYSDLDHISFDNTINNTYFNCKNTILYQYMNRPSVNSYNSLSTTNQTSTNLRVDSSNSYTNKFYFLKLGNSYYYYLTGIYADYLPTNTSVPVFTPHDSNGFVSVTSNGVTVSLPRLTFSYTGQRYYTLGYLSNYKENNDFYNFEGNFGPYVSSDIIDGSMSTFHFDYENGSLNGSLAFNYTTGEISILATKLIDNQTYNLYLQYSKYNGQYQQLGSYDFYATYYTNHATSGDLISPDLQSSVDIGFVNALDDFFDYNNTNSGDLNYLLGTSIFDFSTSGDNFSGDFFSGDLFNKLGFFGNKENKYDLFIYRIYRNILNVLGSNTDYSITITYRNFSKTLHGSDFFVPSGPLKTFITLFLLGGFVILFYQQLHFIYMSLISLDIFGFVKSTDHEHSFFM